MRHIQAVFGSIWNSHPQPPMARLMLLLLLLLAAAMGITAADEAGPPLPYPRSAKAPARLRVYSAANLAAGDEVTLETLGGGLARQQPELYRVSTTVKNADDAYTLWLSEMEASFGVTVRAVPAPPPRRLRGCTPHTGG